MIYSEETRKQRRLNLSTDKLRNNNIKMKGGIKYGIRNK